MKPPLQGIRVLAVEQYGAGPYGSMLLGDLGAEIIKVEDPVGGGDVARTVPPYLGDEDSVYFQALNRRKKSIALDTRTEEGRRLFHALVSKADAVYTSLRGDQVESRGLTYEHLESSNPRVVCCALTGFGRQGPRKEEPGYDYLMQAYAGWMSITGEPDGPPQKSGLSVVDLSAGIAAAFGLVAGVLHARATGEGGDVDVSLFATAVSQLTYVGAWHLTYGYDPVRMPDSSHPSQIPSQVLPTLDGWMVVMCAKEKFFRRLVHVLGESELAKDERFSSFSARLENRDELVRRLKQLTRQRTTAEWLDLLRGHVPCAPVQSVAEALDDPQTHALDMIKSFEHPQFGTVHALGSPVRVPGADAIPVRGPHLGEHTRELLGELGCQDDEIDQLAARSVVRLADERRGVDSASEDSEDHRDWR